MGSHGCRPGICESARPCSDLPFIVDLIYSTNRDDHFTSDDRQMGSKNDLDDRVQRLPLSLRAARAH